MDVRFLGCGDAFGSGGRFNTCFHVTHENGVFLIDCGASSLIAMKKFGVDPNAIRTVFVSHLHADHFHGLPNLILDAQLFSRRSAPLTLVGPPGFTDALKAAMEFLFPGSSATARKFALEIVEIGPGETRTVDGVTVSAFLAVHATSTPPLALRFACDGKVLSYTGDSEWTESLIEAGRDADLLIAEAFFFDRQVRFHLDYGTLKANLGRIGARRVILTHMGSDMLAHAAEVPEEKAQDGMIVRV